MRLRGFHSKSNSSTASSTAATGEAKVADIPPAAPATSNVRRSALVRRKNCAIIEPKAPPVMMIGPSAPNGPPEPMEIAEESGFGNAMAADAFRAETRHQADDQRPSHRHQHDKRPKMVARRGDQRGLPTAEEEKVGKQSDQ